MSKIIIVVPVKKPFSRVKIKPVIAHRQKKGYNRKPKHRKNHGSENA